MTKFEKELRKLMEKHNVLILEYDSYNGLEEYCGSEYFFKFREHDNHHTLSIIDLME